MQNELDLLGDVHLGKHFRTGVPLHRMGHREEMIWSEFKDRVMNPKGKIFVQVGDLFNEFAVAEAIVLRAFEIVANAAANNPEVMYIFYRGNHDASRDADKKSSFDIFQALCTALDLDNLFVLSDPLLYDDYAFLPWHPFKSSTELAHELLEMRRQEESPTKLKAVFGHWEIQSFGGTDDNLVPTNLLKYCTDTIITGHIHQKQEVEIDGMKVIVTGSMQPYSHAEDLEGKLYVTLSADVLALSDYAQFKDKNVRVLMRDDQALVEFDCLSLITKRVETAEEEHDEVVMEEFDLMGLFRQSLQEKGVGSSVSEKILNKFQEKRHA